ncbi:MAG TPA: hypothetical protein VFU81_00950, partial [Thermomicrobiales bacterium]|nr:hypothetical protein [Thermomicrobiales bacterium]
MQAAGVTQFAITGYIESFTLNDPNDPLSGAQMRVNGTDVVVPKNLIVQMPTIFLTPFDIFCLNPKAPDGAKSGDLCIQAPPESGLAMNDNQPPLAPFEATIQGNIVGDAHIAGLVYISQEFLNAGAGYIKSIDLATAEIVVGHDPGTPVQPTDARLKLDDPKGIHGRPMASPDLDTRFTIDPDSPSVRATTGFPMCVPRGPGDALCPDSNRPAGMTKFVMWTQPLLPPRPGSVLILPCSGCDAARPAPFVVGDYINYSGTLAKDGKGLYISAHTVVASLGIFTAPNSPIAYTAVDLALIGTFGPSFSGIVQEQLDRVRVRGFTTDPTRPVNVYAIDVDPSSGQESMRLLGSVGTRLARFGEFRLLIGKGAGALVDGVGNIRGATREIAVAVPGARQSKPYYAPVTEFLFPENDMPGDPLV